MNAPFAALRRNRRLNNCLWIGLLASILSGARGEPFKLSWTNNLLTVSRPGMPGGLLQIWYLEAFLSPGAHGQEWGKSVRRHSTRLLETTPDGHRLRFLTTIEPDILVRHEVQSGEDELDLRFELENRGKTPSDIQWFQPACIRVDAFTGRDQQGFTGHSFIFTADGLRTFDQLRRTTNALYKGGQVYVPAHVNRADANPRPVCLDKPVNGLIGCFSADGRWILATASDRTHELFEGVYVCIHSDPLIGGIQPGEKRSLRQKVYLLPNEPERLLERYRHDFPESRERW